jgi:hypothetical protein
LAVRGRIDGCRPTNEDDDEGPSVRPAADDDDDDDDADDEESSWQRSDRTTAVACFVRVCVSVRWDDDPPAVKAGSSIASPLPRVVDRPTRRLPRRRRRRRRRRGEEED